jgi:hypothetical protein
MEGLYLKARAGAQLCTHRVKGNEHTNRTGYGRLFYYGAEELQRLERAQLASKTKTFDLQQLFSRLT